MKVINTNSILNFINIVHAEYTHAHSIDLLSITAFTKYISLNIPFSNINKIVNDDYP